MATPGLEDPPALADAHACGASATVEFGPEPPPNRALAVAWGFAAAAHILALLTLGLAAFHSGKTANTVPEISLFVEESGAIESRRESSAPADTPTAPAPQGSEELLAASASTRAAPTAVAVHRVATHSAPTLPDVSRTATGENPAPSAAPDATPDPIPTEAPKPDEAVVTTVAASDHEVPAHAEPPPAPAVAINSSQESMLSQWIMQAAQGLQKANLRQLKLSLSHKGRRYTAYLERRPAADAMGVDHIRVEITTEENGRLLRTLLQLKQLAFSHFTQLVDQWDPRQALHADAIEGRFHSNSEITLLSDGVTPRVLGKLTTSAGRVNSPNFGARALREIFRGGIEMLVPPIALPAEFPGLAQSGAERAKVHALAHNTSVTFHADGSYSWRDLDAAAPEERREVSTPRYLVAARGVTVAVRGTVRGTVVVYSPEGIVVEGNLLYAHDPRGSEASDYLGLISSKDVAVAAQSVTGPGDLRIQAAIYARRRFFVPDGYVPPGPSGCPCPATLFIDGSVSAGWISPTEPRYATHYAFDPRFEQVRPPGFPVTNQYELESWDSQWREARADEPGSAEQSATAPAAAPEASARGAGSAAIDAPDATQFERR